MSILRTINLDFSSAQPLALGIIDGRIIDTAKPLDDKMKDSSMKFNMPIKTRFCSLAQGKDCVTRTHKVEIEIYSRIPVYCAHDDSAFCLTNGHAFCHSIRFFYCHELTTLELRGTIWQSSTREKKAGNGEDEASSENFERHTSVTITEPADPGPMICFFKWIC